MTQPIIEVKNLSKEYIISHNVQPYYTLRDSFFQIIKKPFIYFSSKESSSKKEKFLALKDVNFSVMPGEVVGIIGRNGAGKSTLLKILSQITPPTSGSAHLRGRVASLLEVGTGFHPELTGRENIFLNGAILGMTQKEIAKKFDEIVAFAEIEKFLDTPVKRYSSGMYVRLAFAVAAHLEPEILVIDEVLAVGDASFQKRCLGKMDEISKKDGRTVLFVSHNMSAIKQLCRKCILLDEGKIRLIGETGEVIKNYLESDSKITKIVKTEERGVCIKNIIFKNKNGVTDFINTFDEIEIEIVGEAAKDFDNVSFAICFNNIYNVRVTSVWTDYIGKNSSISKGRFKAVFKIPSIRLIPGEYEVISYVESRGKVLERVDGFRKITVFYTDEFEVVREPIMSQGLYVEKFNFLIK
jgi:lipopolysaccharide transport system ATP-binding protein